MEKDNIISFNKPSQDVIDIAPHFYSGEYRPHDMAYGLNGLFHILLMHEAGKLRSEQELPDFMKIFSIQLTRNVDPTFNFSRKGDTAFTFSINKFIDSGLLVPRGELTVVLAFNRDLFNMYPGVSEKDMRTAEWERQYASSKFLNERNWISSDFLNPDIIKQGKDFGTGVWNKAVQSYKKYYFPEMKAEISQNAQKLLDYYSLIIQQAK